MTYDGRGVYHCDTCPEHLDTEETDFEECRAVLKQKGWRAYKGPDGLWAHSCPSCTEDFAKEKRRQ